MSDQRRDPEPEFDRIDADAVCEACGTVNPEETLFCKSCGNNLRDQRVHRIAAGRGIEELEEEHHPVQWLSGALVLLGILVVIWTAINVSNGNMVEWLLSTQHTLSTTPSPESLWNGPDSGIYDALLKEINDQPVTADDIASTTKAAAPGQGVDGRYYLKSSASGDSAVIGQAVVKAQGGQTYFVAKLARDVEVRGQLDLARPNIPKTITAAARIGGQYVRVYGVGQRAADGSCTCYAQERGDAEQNGATEPTMTAVAYPISPASGGASSGAGGSAGASTTAPPSK